MDTQTLITKSGNWSDDNLTIPFEKGMDKQIRDMLLDSVEEALKDKEYCCKDPFGTGRFNVKRQDSARIKKVGSNAVVVLIRVVLDKSYCSQVCRELILRDVLPCIQHVASQFGTRSVVLPRDTARVTERQLPQASGFAGKTVGLADEFECRFYRTSHYDDESIPTEKFEWDAFCACLADLQQNVPTKRKLKPSDFGIVFKMGRYEYELAAADKYSPEKYVVGRRIGNGSDRKEVRILREKMSEILYEQEYEDKDALALEKERDEEAAFYRNKSHIQHWLTWRGIDIAYREFFSVVDHDYIIIGIQPNARTYPIVVRCVDEDGPLSGKVIRLPLEETLSAIVEDRKRH